MQPVRFALRARLPLVLKFIFHAYELPEARWVWMHTKDYLRKLESQEDIRGPPASASSSRTGLPYDCARRDPARPAVEGALSGPDANDGRASACSGSGFALSPIQLLKSKPREFIIYLYHHFHGDFSLYYFTTTAQAVGSDSSCPRT